MFTTLRKPGEKTRLDPSAFNPAFAFTVAATWLSLLHHAQAQAPASTEVPAKLLAAAERNGAQPGPSAIRPRAQKETTPPVPAERGPQGPVQLFRRLSGVSIDRLQPAPYEGELKSQSEKISLPDLHLLDLRMAYEIRPEFLDREPYTPVLELLPPGESPGARGLKNLVQKEFFRQLRRLLKRQWRGTLKDQPNMGYDLYESRLLVINRIGRDMDALQQDYYSSQVREAVFRRGKEGESEIPVMTWGPLTLLDSGGLNVDVSLLRGLFSQDEPSGLDSLEVGPEAAQVRRPLFSGKSYRVNTGVRMDINPFRALQSGDVLDTMRSYGGVIDVVWLTDILRRDRFITEVEAQYRRDGELVVFFNFVMKSR